MFLVHQFRFNTFYHQIFWIQYKSTDIRLSHYKNMIPSFNTFNIFQCNEKLLTKTDRRL